jgi:transporter family-2 protein
LTKVTAIMMAVMVGFCISLQATINTALGRASTPKNAALFSFLLGTAALLVINGITGELKSFKMAFNAPYYLLIGGLLGAIIVFSQITVIPVIGVGTTISLMVTVQLITGIIIDHFGWLGTPKTPVDLSRIFGVILLLISLRFIIK